MSSEKERYDTFLSVCVPLTNAAPDIAPFVIKLNAMLQARFRNFEIVLIDNHSVDDTVDQVYALQTKIGNVQLYTLNRRCDFEVALIAGLDNSIGDFVITMNYQTDPIELVPEFFALTRNGNSFVCGVQRDQLQRKAYRWFSRRFSSILRATTGVDTPIGMSDFRLYSRGVLGFIHQNADRHMLLKLLPFLATTKFATIEYSAMPEAAAIKRRGMTVSFLSSITILLASSSAPLRLLTGLTLTVSLLSLAYAGYVVLVALLKHNVVEGWVSIALPMAVMFFFVSTILGVLSEFVFRMAQHVSNSPMYMISGESTSSAMELQRKLNVVQRDGEFVERAP